MHAAHATSTQIHLQLWMAIKGQSVCHDLDLQHDVKTHALSLILLVQDNAGVACPCRQRP